MKNFHVCVTTIEDGNNTVVFADLMRFETQDEAMIWATNEIVANLDGELIADYAWNKAEYEQKRSLMKSFEALVTAEEKAQ